MGIPKTYKAIITQIKKLDSPVLLFMRLVLAYGFYKPAQMKWQDIAAVASWFKSMNYPLPQISAYLAASTEILGVVLLALGFGTRIISIPLMIVMLVAIFTVHIGNGFNAGSNGFEIPLYYLIMLLVLITNGAGKYSLDYLVGKQ